jgi:hypothetical protein
MSGYAMEEFVAELGSSFFAGLELFREDLRAERARDDC